MRTIRITIPGEEYERVVSVSEIKMLSKVKDTYNNDVTMIHFRDGNTMIVEESMNIIEDRLNKD